MKLKTKLSKLRHDGHITDAEYSIIINVLNKFSTQPCKNWYDVPSDEMTLEQARQAVKDLRKKLAEYLEQEPKIGHWIETAEEYYKAVNEKGGGVNEDTDYFTDDIACSECLAKFSVIDNEAERFDFCPKCGAKMVEPQESEE